MKNFLIGAAYGLVVLGTSVLTAGSAMASAAEGERGYRDAPRHNRAVADGASRHGYRPDYRRGVPAYRPAQRHAQRYRYGNDRAYVVPQPAHRQGQQTYRAIRPCHSTSKIGFDTYGRRARIGGTMCYDAYGTPYVVQGSRYIIQYF